MPLCSVARPHILWAGYFQTFGPTDCLRGVTQVIIISGKQNHPLLMVLHKYKLVVSLTKIVLERGFICSFFEKEKKISYHTLGTKHVSWDEAFLHPNYFFFDIHSSCICKKWDFPSLHIKKQEKKATSATFKIYPETTLFYSHTVLGL